MGFRPRQNVEGKGEEAVAGQDGGCFVIGLVGGRPSAPQIVIVHGRQVVMHQRIAVDEFECGAGHQGLRARHAEQARRLDHQERAKTLAAAQAAIAHGVEQPLRPRPLAVRQGRGQELVEQRFGVLGDVVEAGSEEVVAVQVAVPS